MTKGFPVVVVLKGGIPVTAVDEGAPLATVAENGFGTPITIAPNGTPLVVQGLSLWTPTRLFEDGEPGYWAGGYNPSGGRLFVSSTTPAMLPGELIYQANRAAGTADAGPQPTALSRPTLARWPKGGRRNLLTWTEDFGNAAWVKVGGSGATAPVVTPNAAVSPIGDNTADLVAFSAVSGSGFSVVNQLAGTLQPSVILKGTVWVKAATAGDVGRTIYIYNAGQTNTHSHVLTADWQRIETTGVSAGPTYQLLLASIGASNGGLDQPAFSVHLWGAQLEVGSVATPYQRVTTQYDVTEYGIPVVWHLSNDGGDSLPITLPAGLYVRAWVDTAGVVTFDTVVDPADALVSNQQADIILRQGAFTPDEEDNIRDYWAWMT